MFGAQRQGQKTTILYHGVSAMALKGLQDMGTNIGDSSSSFSQLPTQSVCLPLRSAPPRPIIPAPCAPAARAGRPTPARRGCGHPHTHTHDARVLRL
jgi:hypothetical protein